MNKQVEGKRTVHPFPPLYNKESKILLLGSFPSVKSREQLFYYGHPQNRFWKVIAGLYFEEVPTSIEEKKELLCKHNIALWDSIHSCQIQGSSDASITNVKVNDIETLLKNSSIQKIYCNGVTSYKIYEKYLYPKTKIHSVCLPSTSAANAIYTLDKLIDAYSIIKE